MISWIRERRWLPEILLTLVGFLALGGADLILQGPIALIPGAFFALAVTFARSSSWLPSLLIGVGTAGAFALGEELVLTGFLASAVVLIQAAFTSPRWSQVSGIVSNLAGFVFAYSVAYESRTLNAVGLAGISQQGRFILFVFAALLVVAVNTLAWLAGRLLMTRLTHVGTDLDQAAVRIQQSQLRLDIARQKESIGIARDITDLLVQRISAVVSQADGGKYIAAADQEAAARVLDRVGTSARQAQVELRRLFDLLNNGEELSAAPPGLRDIEIAIVDMREHGYNASLNIDGDPYEIDEGAELCIFNIVFDSLLNVKKHTPRGTNVTVDLFWTKDGLQVLVKDNGVEVERRLSASADEVLAGYTAEEDLAAIVERIEGATLAALGQRAALYEGTIEAKRVPGVGFTVSALFPNLRQVAGAK